MLLGKVASDIQKPDGRVIITESNLPDVLPAYEAAGHLRYSSAHGKAVE
jgi:hypothetical protein